MITLREKSIGAIAAEDREVKMATGFTLGALGGQAAKAEMQVRGMLTLTQGPTSQRLAARLKSFSGVPTASTAPVIKHGKGDAKLNSRAAHSEIVVKGPMQVTKTTPSTPTTVAGTKPAPRDHKPA